jgi:hypothetical protein
MVAGRTEFSTSPNIYAFISRLQRSRQEPSHSWGAAPGYRISRPWRFVSYFGFVLRLFNGKAGKDHEALW